MTHPDRLAYAAHNAEEKRGAPYVPPYAHQSFALCRMAASVNSMKADSQRAIRAYYQLHQRENEKFLRAAKVLADAAAALQIAIDTLEKMKEEDFNG